MNVEVLHRSRARPGELVCGDAAWSRRTPDGVTFAVIDATGHGREAHAAASAAVAFLAGTDAPVASIGALITGLHHALRGGRGASATVCRVRAGVLVGAGVGNVEIRAVGRSIPAVIAPGILGHRVGTVRPFEIPLAAGDRIILWSDGIPMRDVFACERAGSAEDVCSALLARALPTDDATILVADVTTEEGTRR